MDIQAENSRQRIKSIASIESSTPWRGPMSPSLKRMLCAKMRKS